MSWQWRYEGADGGTVSVGANDVAERFPSQSDAESWLGENWRALTDAGVRQVTLVEDGREVYGPMSLEA